MVGLTDARVKALNRELPRLIKQVRQSLDSIESASGIEIGQWHLATIYPPLASMALLLANANLPGFENRMHLES